MKKIAFALALLAAIGTNVLANAQVPSPDAVQLTETQQIDSGPIKGRVDGKIQ